MFEEIVNIVSKNSFNTNANFKSKYDLEIDSETRNYLLSTLPSYILQNIICNITKQTKINEMNITCYNYDSKLKSFVEQEQEQEQEQEKSNFSDSSFNPFTIEYYSDMVFLEMINIEDLAGYLHVNLDCNYVAFPVIHGFYDLQKKKENEIKGHISVIIFDNKNNLAYHIDSNGWNKTKKFLQLENFIEQKISMLEGFGLNYNYIRCEYWNNEQIYLNVNYHHKELNDTGNCMIWTILMIKLMKETNFFPGELFDKLEKLNYEEKIYIMKTYGTILLNKYDTNRIRRIKNM
jgi:hypothetical protein